MGGVGVGTDFLRQLTLPLDDALNILQQPVQPLADASTYADAVDSATFERNLPNFYRQVQQELQQAQQDAVDQHQAWEQQQQEQAQAEAENALAQSLATEQAAPDAGYTDPALAEMPTNLVVPGSAPLASAPAGVGVAIDQSPAGLNFGALPEQQLEQEIGRERLKTLREDAGPGGLNLSNLPQTAMPGARAEGEQSFPDPSRPTGIVTYVHDADGTTHPIGEQNYDMSLKNIAGESAAALQQFADPITKPTSYVASEALKEIARGGLLGQGLEKAGVPSQIANPLSNLPGSQEQKEDVAGKIGEFVGPALSDAMVGGLLTPIFTAESLAQAVQISAAYKDGDISGKEALKSLALVAPNIIPLLIHGTGKLAEFTREHPEVVEQVKQNVGGALASERGNLKLGDEEPLKQTDMFGEEVKAPAPTAPLDVPEQHGTDAQPLTLQGQVPEGGMFAPGVAPKVEEAASPASINSSPAPYDHEAYLKSMEGKTAPSNTIVSPDSPNVKRVRDVRATAEPIEGDIQGARVFTSHKAPELGYDQGSYYYRPDEQSYVGVGKQLEHRQVEERLGLTSRELTDRGWVRLNVNELNGQIPLAMSGSLPEDLQQAARSMIRDGMPGDTRTVWDYDGPNIPGGGDNRLSDIANGKALKPATEPGHYQPDVPLTHEAAPSRIIQVRRDQLILDPEYQARATDAGKPFNQKRAENMAANFDPALDQPVLVAPAPDAPGKYIVGGGFHRTAMHDILGTPTRTVQIADVDLSTPEGRAKFKQLADASNLAQAPITLAERINVIQRAGTEDIGELRSKFPALNDQQIHDAIYISHLPEHVQEKLSQLPDNSPLTGIASEVGYGAKAYGLSPDEAEGLYNRLTEGVAKGKLPTRSAVRETVDKFGALMQNRQQGDMFGGSGQSDFAASNRILDTMAQYAQLSKEIEQKTRQLARDIAGAKRLGVGEDTPQIQRAKVLLDKLGDQRDALERGVLDDLGSEAPSASATSEGLAGANPLTSSTDGSATGTQSPSEIPSTEGAPESGLTTRNSGPSGDLAGGVSTENIPDRVTQPAQPAQRELLSWQTEPAAEGQMGVSVLSPLENAANAREEAAPESFNTPESDAAFKRGDTAEGTRLLDEEEARRNLAKQAQANPASATVAPVAQTGGTGPGSNPPVSPPTPPNSGGGGRTPATPGGLTRPTQIVPPQISTLARIIRYLMRATIGTEGGDKPVMSGINRAAQRIRASEIQEARGTRADISPLAKKLDTSDFQYTGTDAEAIQHMPEANVMAHLAAAVEDPQNWTLSPQAQVVANQMRDVANLVIRRDKAAGAGARGLNTTQPHQPGYVHRLVQGRGGGEPVSVTDYQKPRSTGSIYHFLATGNTLIDDAGLSAQHLMEQSAIRRADFNYLQKLRALKDFDGNGPAVIYSKPSLAPEGYYRVDGLSDIRGRNPNNGKVDLLRRDLQPAASAFFSEGLTPELRWLTAPTRFVRAMNFGVIPSAFHAALLNANLLVQGVRHDPGLFVRTFGEQLRGLFDHQYRDFKEMDSQPDVMEFKHSGGQIQFSGEPLGESTSEIKSHIANEEEGIGTLDKIGNIKLGKDTTVGLGATAKWGREALFNWIVPWTQLAMYKARRDAWMTRHPDLIPANYSDIMASGNSARIRNMLDANPEFATAAEEAARNSNNLAGFAESTLSKSEKQLQGSMLNAPAMTRAIVANLRDTMAGIPFASKNPAMRMRGTYARQYWRNALITTSTLAYLGTMAAQGGPSKYTDPTDRNFVLNPASGKFLTVVTPNGTSYSFIPSPIRSPMKALLSGFGAGYQEGVEGGSFSDIIGAGFSKEFGTWNHLGTDGSLANFVQNRFGMPARFADTFMESLGSGNKPGEALMEAGKASAGSDVPLPAEALAQAAIKGEAPDRGDLEKGLLTEVGAAQYGPSASQKLDEYLKTVKNPDGSLRFPDGSRTVSTIYNTKNQFLQSDPKAQQLNSDVQQGISDSGNKKAVALQDIRNKRLQTINDAEQTFKNDPNETVLRYKTFREAVTQARADAAEKERPLLTGDSANPTADQQVLDSWFKTLSDNTDSNGKIDTEAVDEAQGQWKADHPEDYERLVKPFNEDGLNTTESYLRQDRQKIEESGWWKVPGEAWSTVQGTVRAIDLHQFKDFQSYETARRAQIEKKQEELGYSPDVALARTDVVFRNDPVSKNYLKLLDAKRLKLQHDTPGLVNIVNRWGYSTTTKKEAGIATNQGGPPGAFTPITPLDSSTP